MDDQQKFLSIEHLLIKLSDNPKGFRGCASAVQNLVYGYVQEDKRSDFIADLKDLITPAK